MLDRPEQQNPVLKPKPEENRPLRVFIVSGSGRRQDGCPGLDSKARFLMQRMASRLPAGWQIDTEDIGNQHGKPKIQGCNGCVSSSMALCVWPCNCYGPNSTTQPDLLWDLDLYGRLARADAWAFIGPIWWYSPTTNFKTMFDRLVCMNGGNPRPNLIDKKSTVLAQALERSPEWEELSKNHLEGRSAGFFCYGDKGGADMDETGRPKNLEHKEWFDPKDEPENCDAREAYQGLVWQCRYSGIQVPDLLWQSADFGVGKLYADDQVDDIVREEPEGLAKFDAWTEAFAGHVQARGLVPGTKKARASAKSTTDQ